MKKAIIAILILTLLLSGLLTFTFYSVFSEIDKIEEVYRSKLGTKFVLDNDTLTIVDYSTLNRTYILSNGKVINVNLVK